MFPGDDDSSFYGLEGFFPDWMLGQRRKRKSIGLFPFNQTLDQMIQEMAEALANTGNIADMPQGIPPELVRKKKLPDGSEVEELGPVIFGYSMTVDETGKPVIRQFGNVNPNEQAPLKGLQEKREPLVDVITEGDSVKIVAELAGVKKEEIKVSAESDGRITIETTGEREYRKTLRAPVAIDANSGVSSYNNGILVVTFKTTSSKPKGRQIKVD